MTNPMSDLHDLPAAASNRRGIDRRGVDQIVEAVGARLRELRMQRGLSLQQLADRSGVSAAAIHKIERNGMVPTITTLLKLAEAFDRPVGYFVDEVANEEGPVVFTPADQRPIAVSSRRGVDVRTISGSSARFVLGGTVTTVAPGADSGPAASQGYGEELVLVLEGALRFDVEGREYCLRAGDALHLRSDRAHRWENPSDKPAQAAWITLRPLQTCPFSSGPGPL